MTVERLIAAARGDRPVDLLLRNGRVINVYSGEILEWDIAVADGHIVGFGRRDRLVCRGPAWLFRLKITVLD